MDFLKDKRVLVTGGSGFVGTNLLKRLLESDCKLSTTIHKSPPQFTDNRIEYINVDLTTPEGCLKLLRTKIISSCVLQIHLVQL